MEDLVINYEELLLGAFMSALLADHDTFLSDEEMLTYESSVAEYCQENNIDTVIKSGKKEKEAFKKEHSEFLMINDGIKLITCKEWEIFKNKLMNMKEEKINALFSKNAVLVFCNDNEKTLSLR